MLTDDESGSYWDHVTGQAVHGPLKGHQLERWPLNHTTVGAARRHFPQLAIYRVPARTPTGLFMRLVHKRSLETKGFIPPFFRRTMGEEDKRLPETTNGLGVVVGERARFFPMRALANPVEEDWGGRRLQVAMGEEDGAPHAIWLDDNSRPMQLLSRWYGFSYTYPQCEIAGQDA